VITTNEEGEEAMESMKFRESVLMTDLIRSSETLASAVLTVLTRSEVVNQVIDLADAAYPQGQVGPSFFLRRPAYEELITYLQKCRTEDLIAIRALAYCGARYYRDYEDALAAAREDTDEQTHRCLANRPFLADWLRAGLACDQGNGTTNGAAKPFH